MTRHVSDVQLRWADMDALGHVNNVVHLRYLQEARVDMLFVHAAEHGAEDLASGVVVSRHEITYRAPLMFRPRPVRVETWVRDIRPASFRLGYEVVDVDPESGARTVYVAATSTLVPYDLAAGRPRRVRDEERAVLEMYREDELATATPAGPGGGSVDERPATRHRYPCRVRFDDLDSYGHVNNVTFVEYMQEARIDFAHRHLRTIGDLSKGSVVAHQSVDYLAPVPFRTTPLDVDTWVTRLGRSSFDLAYEIAADGAVVARGTTTLVAWDVPTGRPRPLDDEERSAMENLAGAPA
jgi:acyl-CoA thioester hydrolase